MASRREGDTAVWLHNKLGSTDDLWSGRSICSQLSREKLQDIIDCFYGLQAHVKVKLLLSLLHITKRNLAEWKTELDEIIDLAKNDHDQWVSTTGEILKTFPTTFLVNTNDLSGSNAFQTVFSDLKKMAKKSADSPLLPLEASALGKSALQSTIGAPPPTVKHFSLKRKPKAAALKTDLLAKARELKESLDKGTTGGMIPPMKSRSEAKRMDVEIMSTSKSSSGFLKANTLSSFNAHRTSSVSLRKEGGAKILDISHLPPTGKEAKRRKKLEEQEAAAQAKREKEEVAAAAAAASAAAAVKATPEYAVGLTGNTNKTAAPTKISRPPTNPAVPTPSYIPNTTPSIRSNIPGVLEPVPLQPTAPQVPVSIVAPMRPIQHAVPAPRPVYQPLPVRPRPPTAIMASLQPQHIRLPANHTAAAFAPPQHTQTTTVTVQPSKKALSLTKEQMVEAQDMFKNSNKVTRPEKALILGFMAGSRQNPCPQNGHIVNIKLSENREIANVGGFQQEVVSETYFQMNYQSGEWKRVKKHRDNNSMV